ncbi:conjugal transfer protein TraO [Chryseobacterium kwangjuense]|uniref:Conjugal transfer protein TraO n=1 Tax=Chryseobacterium kwangjuense TaxID=267125 RepID=A0A135WJ14_9FLAO|nr:conjugal transfer protein TraO [Chryseobacterium kwangjuense]KXH84914.1 conjugal transfer protein TraO [Chryseobacterium kwangjuense]
MKKYSIFLILTLISIHGYSQRMVYKQKALEVSTGLLSTKEVRSNYYVNLTLNSYARRGNYWIWSAEFQRRTTDYKQWKLPLENYLGEVGYSVQLLSDAKKFITLNAGLTGVAGYEVVNRGDSLLSDGALLLNEGGFIFGTGGRLSLETYLSDRVVLLLQGRIRVLWGTDLEQFRPSSGVGLRINF